MPVSEKYHYHLYGRYIDFFLKANKEIFVKHRLLYSVHIVFLFSAHTHTQDTYQN